MANLEQVKAAAKRTAQLGAYPDNAIVQTDIGNAVRTLRAFALAAIPMVEAAEEAVGRIRYGVSREMGSDVVKILDTALAKLRESE